MPKAIPAYIPWHIANDEFLLMKFSQIVARGKVPPRKLVEELEKRGLLNEALKRARIATKSIMLKNGQLLKMKKLAKILEMLPRTEALELGHRLEFFSNFKFRKDGEYKGHPVMILQITVEFVEVAILVNDGEGGITIEFQRIAREKFFNNFNGNGW